VRTRAGGQVVGRVRTLSPGLDANTRTATVYVDLPDPGDLRAGMFAEGRILLGSQPALVVPASAVVRRDGYSYVFTVDEHQRAQRLRVDLGHRDGDNVEVREGLSAGARVIGKGAAFLSDGDPVRVVGG
jgi:RND family efflux transporter MFP subunit